MHELGGTGAGTTKRETKCQNSGTAENKEKTRDRSTIKVTEKMACICAEGWVSIDRNRK